MRLAAFDFDGTLSDAEMIDRLGDRAGVETEMSRLTERAMAGELDYGESLRQRAALLAGLPLEEATGVYRATRLRPGAADILAALDTAGVTTAILTGGFVPGVRRALEQDDISVDIIAGNTLADDGECLTGEVAGPLIETEKGVVLQEIAEDHDILLANTVVIGDGANDVSMVKIAGLGVGYNPKPVLARECDVTVSSMEELLAVFQARNLLE